MKSDMIIAVGLSLIGFVACTPGNITDGPDDTDCIDSDADGYGEQCAAGEDCDDSDAGIFQMLTGYVDADGDGHGAGAAQQVCSGDTLPAGFSSEADDCDDNDPSHWNDCPFCIDEDGDGYGEGCQAGLDCDDSDAGLYQMLTGYVDADGDGHGAGAAQQVCSGDTLPAGFSSEADDCDDSDGSIWTGCDATCTGCGDAAPCSGGKTCNNLGQCVLLNRGEGDCHCDANCSTGHCVEAGATDYCCDPGEIWKGGSCGAQLSCNTTYYISTSGDDTNDGQSEAAAWQTIDKVISSTFQPGDCILFRASDTWHSQITIPSSGSSGDPITISSYGSGAKPAIDLAQEITGWSVHSGSIYKADVSFDVQQVFLDGEFMYLAHEPDDGARFTADGGGRYFLIENDEAYPTNDLVGAGVIVRAVEWQWDFTRITNYDSASGRISLDGTGAQLYYELEDGDRYVLTDKLWMLDSPGEWYYEGGTLYARMPDDSDPSSHSIHASHDDYGIYAKRKHYITIDGLEIRHAAHSGVYFEESNDIIVRNCELHDIGSYRLKDMWEQDGNGVYFSDCGGNDCGVSDNKALIENNVIRNTTKRGVQSLRYWAVEVSGNLIEDIGIVGYPDFPGGRGYGIHHCEHSHNNIVQNTEYVGISMGINPRGDWTTEKNYINNTCMHLTDGGGIYTGRAQSFSRQIIGNVVENSGTINSNTFAIYLDDGANNVEVLDNTVITARRCSYVHFGRDNTFRRNTFYGCRTTMQVGNSPLNTNGTPVVNNIYEDNIAVNPSDDYLVGIWNYWTNDADLASFDRNIYSSADGNRVAFVNLPGTDNDRGYSLLEWQDARGQDLNSKFVPQAGSADPQQDSQILVNRGFTPMVFTYDEYGLEKKWKDLDGNPVVWPLTLEGLESQVILYDSD